MRLQLRIDARDTAGNIDENATAAIAGAIADLAEGHTLEFVVRGDRDAFWWLQNAAQPAGSGWEGNIADAGDPEGAKLVLEPETPERGPVRHRQLSRRRARA